ncbi:amidase [Roseomonas sp. AR75]|uniref:amidase n=1 Tax=Roseomonas sp. AR75 TaxID=2562311 RepID=UPI00197F48FF|nr:amidase family protein [Roseomonas sp. AR75]
MTELWRLPATQLASDIAAKRVSPVEVMEAVLAQAERQHARLNLFVLTLFDAARDAARQAEAAVMRGERLGRLHGVPFTVKDNVAMRGLPTGNGTIAVEAPPAAESWAVVDRLVAVGGIPIGKTTLPEFAHKVLTDSLACGVTRNPWNLERTPGGSSGGASAGLAAGVAPLAIGTDGGGSIRCPASCTGVVGLKATLGKIPNESFPDPFGNYAFVGPMARTVADCALMFDVMQGPEPRDPWSLLAPPMPPMPAVQGLRIGWMEHVGHYRTHPEVLAAMRGARAALEAAGAITEDLRDPCFDDVFETYVVVATTAHAARLGPLEETHGDRMTASMRESIGIGRGFSGADLVRAVDRRGALHRAVQRLFTRFDLIATPTMLAPPAPLDAGGSVASGFYAEWAAPLYPLNLTGHPGASVPVGFGSEGTPIGLQLIGPWHGEAPILAAAAALEQALDWPSQWPDL